MGLGIGRSDFAAPWIFDRDGRADLRAGRRSVSFAYASEISRPTELVDRIDALRARYGAGYDCRRVVDCWELAWLSSGADDQESAWGSKSNKRHIPLLPGDRPEARSYKVISQMNDPELAHYLGIQDEPDLPAILARMPQERRAAFERMAQLEGDLRRWAAGEASFPGYVLIDLDDGRVILQ